jgi:hypothetical protein
MSKICFVEKRFNTDRTKIIQSANEIIAEYQRQGFRLTLRQLYYQFVIRLIIPNRERNYKNLGQAISEARLAGLIDWSAIEDRSRPPRSPPEWDNIEDLVSSAVATYRLPRWNGQENYVELWVEKDALAGVLWPMASRYHVTLMVNRGYSSQSAMYESALRFRHEANEKKLFLLYLGDHDPSGEDMVRDVRDRMEVFGVENLHVEKIALTMEQVEKYNPPPNPAKMTDSRAAGYVALHGDKSWEVDALPPDVLSRLIENRIEKLFDDEIGKPILEQEEKDKAALVKAAKKINK